MLMTKTNALRKNRPSISTKLRLTFTNQKTVRTKNLKIDIFGNTYEFENHQNLCQFLKVSI